MLPHVTVPTLVMHRRENQSIAFRLGRDLASHIPGARFVALHGTAANPAANAALTDPAFVTGRFSVVQSRRHAPAEEPAHV